ncbi:MAG: polyphosphate--glucose phosphotransferase [Acidimicrobiia bacterium]
MKRMGIDIGGSGIKGAVVDLTTGELVSERYRVKTPQKSTPEAVMEVVAEVVAHHGWDGPIGITVPGVVQHGVVLTAANISKKWIDLEADTAFEHALGRPVSVINDADAAGLAEVQYGAAQDMDGVCLLLTFGTGIGSALINDGRLVPNTELGHLKFRGMEAEAYAAAQLVERENMDLDWWAGRVNEFLQHVDFVFNPDVVIFGGGISKRFDDFAHRFDTRAMIIPAALRNNAGIVGAAMSADERST